MDILRLLPKDQYDAALNANAPTALNPFATMSDVITDNMYTANGTTGPGRTVGITDNLTFGSNKIIIDEANNRVGINTPNTSTGAGFRVLATNGNGSYIDGSSSNASAYALKIRNFDGVSTYSEISRFRNSGLVELALNGAQTIMGDTTQASLTVGGGASIQSTVVGTYASVEATNTYTGNTGRIRMFSRYNGWTGLQATQDIRISASWAGGGSPASAALTVHTNNRVSVGLNSTPSSRFSVTGEGNTTATDLVKFESLSGTDRFIQNDAGQTAWGAGVAASISTIFGQHHKTAGYTYGVGYYGNNHSVSAVGIFPQGSTKWGLYVTNQGTYTGVAVMVYGNAISAVTNTNIGIKGAARNGSSYAIGVDGAIVGGASVASSVYVAGVRGNVGPNVHVTGYGGYFLSQQANGMLYTKDIVGVLGIGAENNITNLSTGRVIGGQFRTSTGGGGATLTTHMAINVPSTGNDGVVVFGADLAVGDSMLQVTGDIEVIGNSNGRILPDRLGSGARVRTYAEKDPVSGVWSTFLEEVV